MLRRMGERQVLRGANREFGPQPWERHCRAVRGHFRPFALPLCQSLQPKHLKNVVCTLFPSREEHLLPLTISPTVVPGTDDDLSEVTLVELRVAVMGLQAKNTTLGPDGILGPGFSGCRASIG